MAFYIDEVSHNLSTYSTVPEVEESNENLHEGKLLHRARLSLDKIFIGARNTSLKLYRET